MAKAEDRRNRLLSIFGIRILVLALSVALGVHVTLERAEAGQQTASGTNPSQSVDQGLTDPALIGAFDAHAHMAPDRSQRSIDSIDLAKLAKARGMRGFVIKEPNGDSAPLAYDVRKLVPGVEVFGSITLNDAVGMNAEAVRSMAETTGGWGRVVWFPTFATEDSVHRSPNPNGRFVDVMRDGKLLPEVLEVLDVIAKTKTVESNGELVLASGHSPPEETLVFLREAKARGVKHMSVTHPIPDTNDGRPEWTLAQLKEAAKLGAFIEVRWRLVQVPNAVAKKAAEYIRQLGVENVILVTDLGQQGNPLHPDGLVMMAKWLRGEGFTDQQLNRMMKENPARLMGLPLQNEH